MMYYKQTMHFQQQLSSLHWKTP